MLLIAAATPGLKATPRLKQNTWQARLDKSLLSPELGLGSRLRLLRKAIDDPKLRDDVQSAAEILREQGFGKGHPAVIDILYPTGTTARADLEALVALRRTIPEAVQNLQAEAPELISSATSRKPAPPPNPADVAQSLISLATDSEKKAALEEELKNVFRTTPKGLETPKYTVAASVDGPSLLGRNQTIEIRAYEPYIVARKPMGSEAAGASGGSTSSPFGGADGGDGFTTLANYLFGAGNVREEAMAMTTPVEISSGGGGDGAPSMAFVLPSKNAADPPSPTAGSGVELATVPARLVAAKFFPGLVTDAEVARQTEALLESLAVDGRYTPVDAGAVSVLQYNGPFTLPLRRRNEVAIVVTGDVEAPLTEEEAAEAPIEEAAEEEAQAPKDETVASWYDSGVRL
jgi:hypothetical protein